MRRPQIGRDRLIGALLLGVVAFSPPLLQIFGRGADLLGWPLLYLYLFGAWAGLILLTALHAERRDRRGGPHPGTTGQASPAAPEPRATGQASPAAPEPRATGPGTADGGRDAS